MKRKEIYLPADTTRDKPYLVLGVNEFGATIGIIKQGSWWDKFPQLKIADLGSVAIEQILNVTHTRLGEKIGNDILYATLSDEDYKSIVDTIHRYFMGEIITTPEGLMETPKEKVEAKKKEKPNLENKMYELYILDSKEQEEEKNYMASKRTGYANKRRVSTFRQEYRKDGYTLAEVKLIAKMTHSAIKAEYKVPSHIAGAMRRNAIKIITGEESEKKKKKINYIELFENGFTPEEIASAYGARIGIANQRYTCWKIDKASKNESSVKLKYKKAIAENDILLLLFACKQTVVEFAENNTCNVSVARDILSEVKNKLNENIIFAAGFPAEVAFDQNPAEHKSLLGYEKEIVAQLYDLQEFYDVTAQYHAKMSTGLIPPEVYKLPKDVIDILVNVCRNRYKALLPSKLKEDDIKFISSNNLEAISRRYSVSKTKANKMKVGIASRKSVE